jgi:glucuronoarabinoxylan endo-1,4-beta-xylanase
MGSVPGATGSGVPAGTGGAAAVPTPGPTPVGTGGGVAVPPGGGGGPSGGSVSTGGTPVVGGGGTAPGGGAPATAGAGPIGPDVTVQLTMTKQTITGFGINNTYATESMSAQTLDHLFTTDGDGLGLSILRIGMGSNGDYATSTVQGDTQGAKSRGAKIIGSTWTPPASYKTNNSENDGGHVKPDYYDQWANTITSFATNNGLYAMSVGNEPDFASCGDAEPCNGNYATTLYTGAEMAAFVKVVGPKLQAAGVKVIAPEASEWIHNWSNESACCSENSGKQSSDPLNCGFPPTNTACDNFNGYDYGHALYADQEAWAAFDIMGVHEYDTQHAEPWPDDVPDRKPVWETEMSGVKWWPEQGPSTDIKNGVAVAGWIHSALTVGEASAWLYWWYKAYYTDDNEGLLLKSGADTKRHWTFGNYSKFVRPDYVRVDITGDVPDGVLLSAYTGSDGTVVVVAINNGTASVDLPITIAGGTAPAEMTPWVTSAADNLAAKDPITVTGGIFMASLEGPSVTTFVGN